MNRLISLLLSIMISGSVACQKKEQNTDAPSFNNEPVVSALQNGVIEESSGIADSRKNPGFLWVHEDSGNPPQIFLVGHDGKIAKSIHIAGTVNRDWEELCLGAGPTDGKDYIYVGDIGDNNRAYSSYRIYRFEEPASNVDTVKDVQTISFNYPDGPHDAEAFFVDKSTKDIYVITKRDAKGMMYKLKYPQSTSSMNVAEHVLDLPYSGIVASTVSSNGSEFIIKTYPALYYYRRNAGESIQQVFAKKEFLLPYKGELQGEAVCFANDSSGYFTLSEKGLGSSVSLYFYRRK